MKLFIEGRRDGYSTEQCRTTLTVRELIDLLSEYPEETEVYLKNDNGYTFGSITDDSFEDGEREEQEEGEE